jgi:hypothetical protein
MSLIRGVLTAPIIPLNVAEALNSKAAPGVHPARARIRLLVVDRLQSRPQNGEISMSALFTLGKAGPTLTSNKSTFWAGIEVQRTGIMPQIGGSLVLLRECTTVDELKASVEQMKHELDAVVSDAMLAQGTDGGG